HGNMPLLRVGLDGEIITLLGGERAIPNASIAADGTIAFLATSPTQPLEVFVASATGENERELSRANAAFLEEVTIVPAERFTYPAEGGVEIDAWLLKPPGFDPKTRYPM